MRGNEVASTRIVYIFRQAEYGLTPQIGKATAGPASDVCEHPQLAPNGRLTRAPSRRVGLESGTERSS